MNEWNIQSRAHACQACGKGFANKEVYHTLLMTHKQELQRLDVCKSCWETEHAKPERKGFISHWHALYHVPPPAPPEAIQKETAETLLRRLIEDNDPKHGPACYILAVMLERKRLLKVKEQFKRGGTRVFVYEHPKSGDIFTITDPDLQLNQLEEVQRNVSELMAHGLPDNHATVGQTSGLPVPGASGSVDNSPPSEATLLPNSTPQPCQNEQPVRSAEEISVSLTLAGKGSTGKDAYAT